jgi:branched-chain amino acid transport system substrate-binding protein
MMIRRMFSALAAVAVLCGAGGASAAESYTIETILPLTGANSFVGNEEREAFAVLEAAANRGGGVRGRAIHFAILDSQSSPQLAVQLTSQLLPSHPAVLIGDSGNSTCSAMAPILAGGPVQFCLSNGFRPVRGGNSYVIGASPDQQAAAFAKYARGRGWHRIALLNGNDATGDSAETAMLAELAKPENRDLTVVDKERFNASDISIGAQLAKIRAAGAEVISTYSVGASFGVVLHGLHDAGLDVPICTSQGNLSYVEMKQFVQNLPAALYFVSGPLPAEGQPVEAGPLKATDLAYLDAFRRAGINPDWGHAVAWDTGSVVIGALRARGLTAGPADLRAYFEGLHDLPAIQGMLDFRNGTMRGVADLRVLAWDRARATWSIVSQNGGTPKRAE